MGSKSMPQVANYNSNKAAASSRRKIRVRRIADVELLHTQRRLKGFLTNCQELACHGVARGVAAGFSHVAGSK